MKMIPYLSFKGDCRAAFEFYRAALGGEITMMQTYGDAPTGPNAPVNAPDAIIHARLVIDDIVLMGSDTPVDRYQAPHGFWVSLDIPTTTQAEQVFAALADGGQIQMPIAETFWAPRFGMATDRFGVPWMVNCEHAG